MYCQSCNGLWIYTNMAPPVLEHSPMSNLIVANRLDESEGRAARTSELLTAQNQ
jgi:hypothetical protein